MNAITHGEAQPDRTVNRNPGETDEEYNERLKQEKERWERVGGGEPKQAQPGGGELPEEERKGKHTR